MYYVYSLKLAYKISIMKKGENFKKKYFMIQIICKKTNCDNTTLINVGSLIFCNK